MTGAAARDADRGPASRISARERGQRGEEAAAQWLAAERWRLRERNFRVRDGEIDIIAERDGTIAFFEVKSWSAFPASELEHAVGARKQARIARAARVWLFRHPEMRRLAPRFDVIFRGPGERELHHIENAFAGEVD